MKKNYKRDQRTLGQYDLDGPLDETIEHLSKLKEELETSGWENIRFDIDTEQDYDYWKPLITICGERPKTRQEIADEKDYEARRKAAREIHVNKELELLAELKAKYPDA